MEEKDKVQFQKFERTIGFHKLEGVKVEGDWWALRQFQRVNGKFTQSGCNWYSKEEIRRLLEEEAVQADSGKAWTEKVGEYKLLIAENEIGEYIV